MKKECRQIQPLLAGYALGAVNLDEKSRVEEHLSDCRKCHQELQEYYQVKEGLLYTPGASQPPQELRKRLFSKTATSDRETRTPMRLRVDWSLVGRVAIAVGVLLLVALNASLYFQVRELSQRQQRYEQQSRAYQTSLALLTYYDTEVVELASDSAYGTLIFEPGRKIGALNVRGLDKIPEDRVYQIWLIEPDQTWVSGGLFTVEDPSSDYVSFVIESTKPFREFDAVGITIEPAGGSPGPTGPKVIGTDL